MIGYISSNHGACYIKKTRAQFPTTISIERRDACTIFTGKKFLCISQGMKKEKHGLFIDLSKFSKIMCYYVFFFRNYASYVLRAELCDFVTAHNSGSP